MSEDKGISEKVDGAIREHFRDKIKNSSKMIYDYYSSLVEVGFKEKHAIRLTEVYLKHVLNKVNKNKK